MLKTNRTKHECVYVAWSAMPSLPSSSRVCVCRLPGCPPPHPARPCDELLEKALTRLAKNLVSKPSSE